MAKVLILGAGVAGHTAAMHAKRMLGNTHEITVVTPNSNWNWIPSNIWVGVGRMKKKQVIFPLAPVYKRKKVNLVQAKAVTIHPEGDKDSPQCAVTIEHTSADSKGKVEKLRFDYLINATGPQLRFDLTPGLGPDGFTESVCTYSHAESAAKKLKSIIEVLKTGKHQTLLIGMGHGTCTCEGAAFEYIFNVDHELRRAGVRELADVIYITNENELGDFGVGGMTFEHGTEEVTSEDWMNRLFAKHGIKTIMAAHVTQVESDVVHFEQVDGTIGKQTFDFAMLLPPFRGVSMNALDANGQDISEKLFAANGFMLVDADYSGKPYEQWVATDWPKTYESPAYANIFAVGIAFAPPHGISKPRKSPKGAIIAPAPPRTGMPSGVQGRVAAETIAKRIKFGNEQTANTASMADMGAACIASIGNGMIDGSAATITMGPIVPNFKKFPKTGRDTKMTAGEVGLAGHWIKRLLHTMFIYKAKARPGWSQIPE